MFTNTKINKLYLSLITVLMFNVISAQCDDFGLPNNTLSMRNVKSQY